ncbi:MAG: chorismate synthase [Butyrivibrio sp.]
MAGSTFGNFFRITTWGESHGPGLGAVIDGCPAGIMLSEEDIQIFMDRRKPGQSKFTTQRREGDTVRILSGTFEGRTTGTPIALAVMNEDQRSGDYSEIAGYYRPGHADYTFDAKYGFRDYRGGGRSSGRETVGRVAAGAVAMKILDALGISVTAYAKTIGSNSIDYDNFDINERDNNPFAMPDARAAAAVMAEAEQAMKNKDSLGGIIECVVKNLPVGLGEPVFDKLDANLAKAVMSIGAVKGFEIGDGFKAASFYGSENNDEFYGDKGRILKKTNHSGGVLGGMSDGSDLIFRAAVKPTPSIASVQNTVDRSGNDIEISIKGRHDPMIVPRAVVVVEAMTACTLVDMLFMNMTARMDNIQKIYSKRD